MKKKTKKPGLRNVAGHPSWRLRSSDVEAFITQQGGQMAPLTFEHRGRKLQPLSVAPWWREKLPPDTPPVVKILRGDFFCLPFGGNETPYGRERHPIHGETANARWKLEALDLKIGRTTLHLSLRTRIRKGRVDKRVILVKGHNAVYQQHVISEMAGPMNFGHHAMVKFPDALASGVVSTSKFAYGQVFPAEFERPADGGYSCLEPGATFTSLTRVPRRDGRSADLTLYPAREGFEDLVMLVSDARLPFAWSAVTFPKERYAWFALRDPRVLGQTILWISNGGRHYPPWSGRHRRVMGIEDVTSYFHLGLAESAKANPVSRKGSPTSFTLEPQRPLAVNHIMGTVKIPGGFDRVKTIRAATDLDSVTLTSASGKSAKATLDVAFLQAEPLG